MKHVNNWGRVWDELLGTLTGSVQKVTRQLLMRDLEKSASNVRRSADEFVRADHAGKEKLPRHGWRERISPPHRALESQGRRGDGSDSGRKTPFADSCRGREPQEIDATLARIADDVYFSDKADLDIDGFKRLTADELNTKGLDSGLLKDSKTGLKAALYKDRENGNFVLAFAGTFQFDPRSWKANLLQGTGFEAAQYTQAIRLGKLARNAFGDNLVMTGHSLGGGLAATAAHASGSPAVTFNAAGLSDRTLTRMGSDPNAARRNAADHIRNYVMEGEPLSRFQESSVSAKALQVRPALGHRIALPAPSPLRPIRGTGPIDRVIDLHEMPAVYDALVQHKPWAG
ncbi:phospholipase [Nocardia amamiensis]|uniref:phospholipase n=1 Tax=Nocardia amamiensis TaxID=404578 RepID=UPI000A3E56F8|nr:phospholipase [Nocardia amamiensis]